MLGLVTSKAIEKKLAFRLQGGEWDIRTINHRT